MQDRACLGDRANAYTLDFITLEEGCTVAQEVYLCTGTHDFSSDRIPLKTAPITIGAHSFIGVRAIILPGVTISAGCIVGAGAVVTKSTSENSIYAGNPARLIRARGQQR
jgi:putative colanic acid biosynthesis acetyltransferase WcaF